MEEHIKHDDDGLAGNRKGLPERGAGNRNGLAGSREELAGNRKGLAGNREGLPERGAGSREEFAGNREGLAGNRKGLAGNRKGLPERGAGNREELAGNREGLAGNRKGLPKRKQIRLKGYDYSQEGLYFITICCQDMKHRFGKILHGEMILNEYGQIAHDEWINLTDRFPTIALDAFQIMPNHMHGIIALTTSEVRSTLAVEPPFNPCKSASGFARRHL